MDRASEAAANDLAEVRKLIEGMNALIYSQIQQQQQQQQQQLQLQQQEKEKEQTITKDKEQDETSFSELINTNQLQSSTEDQKKEQETKNTTNDNSTDESVDTNNDTNTKDTTNANYEQSNNTQLYNAPTPQAGAIVEITHLTFNRVLYFQLNPSASIEPVVNWLRLSYRDAGISGMVLQYKGLDGLWKCLLNRDDSLRRIIQQSMKANTILQMRVPREQDLLSSGYTDRRLLALTKTVSMQ